MLLVTNVKSIAVDIENIEIDFKRTTLFVAIYWIRFLPLFSFEFIMFISRGLIMFKDVGSKIKIFSLILFILSVASCAVCALIFGINGNKFNPGLFFGLLFGGPLASYLFYLLLYGFGIIVENNEKGSVQKVERIETVVEKPVVAKGLPCFCLGQKVVLIKTLDDFFKEGDIGKIISFRGDFCEVKFEIDGPYKQKFVKKEDLMAISK